MKKRFITIGSPAEAMGENKAGKIMIMPNAGNGVVLIANENNILLKDLHAFGQKFGNDSTFESVVNTVKYGSYWHKTAQDFLQRFGNCTTNEVLFAAYMVARAKIVKVNEAEEKFNGNNKYGNHNYVGHFGEEGFYYFSDGGDKNVLRVLAIDYYTFCPNLHEGKNHKEILDHVISLEMDIEMEMTYRKKYEIWDIVFSKMALKQLVKEFYQFRILEDKTL